MQQIKELPLMELDDKESIDVGRKCDNKTIKSHKKSSKNFIKLNKRRIKKLIKTDFKPK